MSDLSEIIQGRRAEAAEIDSLWNAMSYKDRAAWWMSAKWYGYMSAEAYCRGDPLNTEISCRFGEPGFFIATRVPYFEAQPAMATIATLAPEPASEPTSEPASEPTSEPTSEPASEPTSEPAFEPASEPAAATIIETPTAEQAPRTTETKAPAETATQTPILAAATAPSSNANKKKKKKHGSKPTNPGEGKTIEIRVGGQSK